MPADLLPSASLLPGALSNEELFWHWRRSLAPFFDSVPLADPRDPPQQPTSRQYHVGQFLFFDTQFSRQKFVRDSAWARRHDDADHVLVQVFLRGRNYVSNGGRQYVEDENGVYAVNLGYEVEAHSADADVLSVVLSRDWLAEQLPSLRDARGSLFAGEGAAARLFTDFLVSLRRNLPHATTDEAPLYAQSLIGLLGSLTTHDDPASSAAQDGAFMAVARHIDDNLGDMSLGVASLCARFRMSRATLFRLFKEHGGVHNYIQGQRLLACFKALSSRRHMNRMIYDVALDYGFANASHLSTLFRQHFGMSPREVREAARGHFLQGAEVSLDTPDGRLPDVELMQLWARTLGASARAVAGSPGRKEWITPGR